MKHKLARILELFYNKKQKSKEEENEEQGNSDDSKPTDERGDEDVNPPFSEDKKV